MTPSAKQTVLAAVLAPWSVVVVCVVWSLWNLVASIGHPPQPNVFPDPKQPWEFVLIFSLYGVPTAYLSLVIFLPIYFLLRHFTVASYWTVILAGLLTCLPSAFFYGVFARTLFFLLPFGAAVALSFLWIVRRGTNTKAEPSRSSR